jgi:MFS family permease
MFHMYLPFRKKFKKTTQLSISRLVAAFGVSGINTIWIIYMTRFGISDSMIGFISAFLVIISLITAFFSTPILEKYNELKILIISIIVQIIPLFPNLYIFIFLAMIISIGTVFKIDSFDILFRDESKNKELNEDEGLMYSLSNVGWLVGPLIAGFFLVEYGINSVFFVGSVFILIGLFMLLRVKIKLPEKKRKNFDTNITKNIKDFIKNKRLILSYIISGGIYIWLALLFVYIPLFIIDSGLGEAYIGVFLSVVVIPLVLFEYEVGKLSEKYGFKPFFILGFFSLTIIAGLMFIFDNIYVTLSLMVVSSIAMSFLEPLQDSFFFSNVKHKADEEKYYPIYATATDIGSFVGKISVAGLLLLLPNKYAFLVIGVFMFIIGVVFLFHKEK